MASLGKKVAGSILALSLFSGMVVAGGVVYVGVAFSCGITALSPVNLANGAIDGAKASIGDAFFNLFASEDSKKRKAIAVQIVQIGQERGFTQRSIAIAVATAIQESNLENRPFNAGHNDLDSMGIFQMRPSQGWGTAAQIMDPVYSINTFYDRLQTIPDRDSRPMIDVAMQIQRPSKTAYEKRWAWDDIATSIVQDNYSGSASAGSSCTSENSVGWRLPLNKGTYTMGDPYGLRFHPIQHVLKLHAGQDLPAAQGTPIYAVHDGKVIFSGRSGGYGNYVQIDHGGGVDTGYGHMNTIAIGINDGTDVRAGQVIGYVGTTGGSTGNHLHFEVRVNGKTTDPVPYMLNLGVDIKANAR
jgi:murein DD-endopeptidase MepM/ murein hydrolase activator NlpD